MDELQILRTRVGEMAAEIERLTTESARLRAEIEESRKALNAEIILSDSRAEHVKQLQSVIDEANAQEPVGVVETVGGYPDDSEHIVKWLAKYKDLKNGDKIYLHPIPAQQSVDRDTIINVLLSVGNMSEGVIADAIISAIGAQKSQAVAVPDGDDGLLPIGSHDHPDCRVMHWSEQELRAIKDYAKRCIAAQGQSPRIPEQKSQAAAIPEWQPIETMPFNTPVLVSDEKIIASMFFYKRKDRGYENSLYPKFMGAGDAEVRVSLYPNGCWSKLKWWRPMLDLPLSASPSPQQSNK